jgi:hypothetical protein
MLRSALVLIHASTGVAGLVTGLGALTPPRPVDNRRWLRRLYGFHHDPGHVHGCACRRRLDRS